MMGDKEEEQSFEGPPEEEGKYDKEVMDLEFKKYNSKDSKKKTSTSASEPSKPSNKHTAKPVNQRGKITKEQMLTAPHSPYFEVRVGQAVFLRQAANDEYAVDNIGEAIKLYERALYHCDFTDSKIGFEQTEEQKQSVRTLKMDFIVSNKAIFTSKLRMYTNLTLLPSLYHTVTRCHRSHLFEFSTVSFFSSHSLS